MKAARLGIAVAVAFLFGAHLALAQGGDAKAGKAIFDKTCATCHGPDGTPKDAVARMLKVEMKHLGSKEVQARSDADIQKIILEGFQKMKAQRVAEKDVASVIAHLRTLAQ
jgi:mono/diheme cytochrome c family protein